METISKEEVRRVIENKKAGEFTAVINQLESGEALCLSIQEFKRRFDTSIPHYFLGRYNRGQKLVSCLRVGDCYFVIKL